MTSMICSPAGKRMVWAVSKADHAKKVAVLEENGMKVQPMPTAVVNAMQSVTKQLWPTYAERMGPKALKALAEYRTKAGN